MSPKEERVWAKFTPLIEAAQRRESEQLDAAFFAEFPRKIDGIPVRPLTLRDYLAHRVSMNPYVIGGEVMPHHAMQFIWVQSLAYRAGDEKALEKWAAAIARRHLLSNLHQGVADFIADTFMLAGGSGRRTEGEPERISQASYLIDRLASAYGWTPAIILALPLQQIFQLTRVMDGRKSAEAGKPPANFFGESDRLFSKALEALNTP